MDIKTSGEVDTANNFVFPTDAWNLRARRIFRWFKRNRNRIREIYQREDTYSKFSDRFIFSMPPPEKATEADILVTAEQVLMGLLEWAYHQKDSYGYAMHEYARTILSTVDRMDVAVSESRLQHIVYNYRKEQLKYRNAQI